MKKIICATLVVLAITIAPVKAQEHHDAPKAEDNVSKTAPVDSTAAARNDELKRVFKTKNEKKKQLKSETNKVTCESCQYTSKSQSGYRLGDLGYNDFATAMKDLEAYNNMLAYNLNHRKLTSDEYRQIFEKSGTDFIEFNRMQKKAGQQTQAMPSAYQLARDKGKVQIGYGYMGSYSPYGSGPYNGGGFGGPMNPPKVESDSKNSSQSPQ